MTDTTDKALDALIDDYRGIMLRHIKTSDGHHMTRALQSRRLVKFDQIVTALRAQLADLQSEALQYQTERLRIAIERAEAAEDRAEDAEAQLAKARPDALREAAGLVQRIAVGYDQGGDEAIACGLYIASGSILALIDTPDPSASSPLSLKSLGDVPQEERERRRDAEFARRGWTQPSPEAVARAALEWAAKCIECGCRHGVCEYPAKCPENDVAELVDAASDPATLAAIVAKAGGGE